MQRGSQIGFFGTRDFPYLKLGIRDYTSKIGASLGIESMLGRWDGKNNPRDYGITRNYGSGYEMKYPIGDRTFCKQWNPEVTRAEREREKITAAKRNFQYFYQNWIYKCPTVPFGMYGSQIRLVWSRNGYFGNLNFPEMLPNTSNQNTYGTKLTSFKTVSPIR